MVIIEFISNQSNSMYQVNMKKHSFPFGSAVRASVFNQNYQIAQQYRDFIFENFNWAVLENSLNWNVMEQTEVRKLSIGTTCRHF